MIVSPSHNLEKKETQLSMGTEVSQVSSHLFLCLFA